MLLIILKKSCPQITRVDDNLKSKIAHHPDADPLAGFPPGNSYRAK